MKAGFAILLVALFSYIELYNAFIFLSYEVNKSEIIQKYCVNKDKPEMHCHGTCHMKKMMIDEENTKEDQQPAQEWLPEIVLFFAEDEAGVNTVACLSSEYPPYANNYQFRFYDEWEVPPKA